MNYTTNDRLFQLGPPTGLLFRIEGRKWWNWYPSNGQVIKDDRGDARNPGVIYIDPSHDLDNAVHSTRQALTQLHDDKRSAIQGYETAWGWTRKEFLKRVTKQREVSDVVPPTKRTCIILGRLFSELGAVGLSR